MRGLLGYREKMGGKELVHPGPCCFEDLQEVQLWDFRAFPSPVLHIPHSALLLQAGVKENLIAQTHWRSALGL